MKSLGTEIDQATALMKSYQAKLKKNDEMEEEEKDPAASPAAPAPAPEMGQEQPATDDGMTPGQEDVIEAAKEGQSGEDIKQYAQGLQQEELEAILEALMDEYETRGGQEQAPGAAPAPQMAEKAEAPTHMVFDSEGSDEEGQESPEHESGELPAEESAEHAPGAEPDMADAGQEPAAAAMPTTTEPSPEPTMGEQPTMSLDEAVAQLSDEELAKLKAIIDAKVGGAGQMPAGAPPVAKSVTFVAPAKKAAETKNAQGTVKADSSAPSLLKSMNSIVTKMEQLIPQGRPATTYSDSNIRVLEKSESEPLYKSGFDLANRLLVEIKKGNKLVKSQMVAEANTCPQEKLAEFVDKCRKSGVELQ